MQTVANILPEQHNLIRGNYCRAQIPELCKDNPDRNCNYIVFSLKKARVMEKKKKKRESVSLGLSYSQKPAQTLTRFVTLGKLFNLFNLSEPKCLPF